MNMTYHIHKTKDKNNMIISIDAEKAPDKILHPFTIQIFNEVDTEEIHLKTTKAICDKSTASIPLSGKLKASILPQNC